MKSIINLFDNNLKLKFLFLIFFMLIASFLELLGLGLVVLILNSFLGLDTSILEILNEYTKHFLKSDIDFVNVIFLIFFLFTIQLVILIFVAWMESDFLASFREKVSN